MELRLQSTVLSVATCLSKNKAAKASDHGNFVKRNIYSPLVLKLNRPARETYKIFCAVPETAASIVVAATIVGAAATLLAKRTEVSEKAGAPTRNCDDCGGTGVCSECNGEGFVLKNLSDESAERARKTAKNMATRYTSGLPKKWSYCTKCSSSRSCRSCDGRGKLSY